jgi:hypothetical protein
MKPAPRPITPVSRMIGGNPPFPTSEGAIFSHVNINPGPAAATAAPVAQSEGRVYAMTLLKCLDCLALSFCLCQLLEAYGSLSMSYGRRTLAMFLKAIGQSTYRILSLDLLRRHKRLLLCVRHFGGGIDVPIALRRRVRANSCMSLMSSA